MNMCVHVCVRMYVCAPVFTDPPHFANWGARRGSGFYTRYIAPLMTDLNPAVYAQSTVHYKIEGMYLCMCGGCVCMYVYMYASCCICCPKILLHVHHIHIYNKYTHTTAKRLIVQWTNLTLYVQSVPTWSLVCKCHIISLSPSLSHTHVQDVLTDNIFVIYIVCVCMCVCMCVYLANSYTFQAIINSNGDITFNYLSMGADPSTMCVCVYVFV